MQFVMQFIYVIASRMNYLTQKIEALKQIAQELTTGSDNDYCKVNM